MYVNEIETDICIIGGGVSGLTMASVAAQLDLNVVLFEGHKMGGDCLNVGCVPSKSILAAAEAAYNARTKGTEFGVTAKETQVDMQAVHDHIHAVIKSIEPHDSVERFEGLGVRVIEDYAAFVDPHTVEGGGLRVKARKFLIATGSVPFIPPINGLSEVPYLTNENIFELTELPDHLVVLGGGPIGTELAQAFRRLGAQVSTISLSPLLPNDDADAVDLLRQSLLDEGIEIYEEAETQSISGNEQDINVTIKTKGGEKKVINGSNLLVATGQTPNISKLNLDKANIKHSPKGIEVSPSLQTSNKKVYAAGDVTGQYQFTHVAEYHTSIAIQKLLFKSPFAKVNYKTIPWVTYTSPEIANVGLNEAQAKKDHDEGNYKVLKFDYENNDRARSERNTKGFIKVIVTPKGKVLGATIIGKSAGELILPWSLAISKGLKLKDIAGQIVPYPTYNEISKRAAGSFYKETLFSPMTKKIIGFLKNF